VLYYLTKHFLKVVLQKSIPAQVSEHILCISKSEGLRDGFVGELTSAKRLRKHFVRDKTVDLTRAGCAPGR
jgi:hypothetical protein